MVGFNDLSAHLSGQIRDAAVGPGVSCTVHPVDGSADELAVRVIPSQAEEMIDEYGGGVARNDEIDLSVGDDREWSAGDEITIADGWAAGKYRLLREKSISPNGSTWTARRATT